MYTLENPSMHYLTFTLTMEASDVFAFAGPKLKTLSLTPMSRVGVGYDVFVYGGAEAAAGADAGPKERGKMAVGGSGKGRWIYPALRVVDAYFNKTLRVLDAGYGVKADGKGGIGVWVPG